MIINSFIPAAEGHHSVSDLIGKKRMQGDYHLRRVDFLVLSPFGDLLDLALQTMRAVGTFTTGFVVNWVHLPLKFAGVKKPVTRVLSWEATADALRNIGHHTLNIGASLREGLKKHPNPKGRPVHAPSKHDTGKNRKGEGPSGSDSDHSNNHGDGKGLQKKIKKDDGNDLREHFKKKEKKDEVDSSVFDSQIGLDQFNEAEEKATNLVRHGIKQVITWGRKRIVDTEYPSDQVYGLISQLNEEIMGIVTSGSSKKGSSAKRRVQSLFLQNPTAKSKEDWNKHLLEENYLTDILPNLKKRKKDEEQFIDHLITAVKECKGMTFIPQDLQDMWQAFHQEWVAFKFNLSDVLDSKTVSYDELKKEIGTMGLSFATKNSQPKENNARTQQPLPTDLTGFESLFTTVVHSEKKVQPSNSNTNGSLIDFDELFNLSPSNIPPPLSSNLPLPLSSNLPLPPSSNLSPPPTFDNFVPPPPPPPAFPFERSTDSNSSGNIALSPRAKNSGIPPAKTNEIFEEIVKTSTTKLKETYIEKLDKDGNIISRERLKTHLDQDPLRPDQQDGSSRKKEKTVRMAAKTAMVKRNEEEELKQNPFLQKLIRVRNANNPRDDQEELNQSSEWDPSKSNFDPTYDPQTISNAQVFIEQHKTLEKDDKKQEEFDPNYNPQTQRNAQALIEKNNTLKKK